MIKPVSSNEFFEGPFCVALCALALEPFIVRIGVTGNAIVVRYIAKLLEFDSVFGADLVTFFTIDCNVFTS